MNILEAYFNALSSDVFEQNVEAGWWDNRNRCIFETLQLVSTEIAEATEGARKDLMDDHLPSRKMHEVELADVIIRLLDLAGRYGWLFKQMAEDHYLLTDESTIGAQHFSITMALTELGNSIYNNSSENRINHDYSTVLQTILRVSHMNRFDVITALEEKLEYNKTRIDHTAKVRNGKHGKKF